MSDLENQQENENKVNLADVQQLVQRHYGRKHWLAVKAAIGLTTALSLKERDNCLVLVFEGASGKGKSVVVRMVMPDRDSNKKYLYRIDDFTPASFVSHAANKSKQQLAQISLLGKLKDKVMETKEL